MKTCSKCREKKSFSCFSINDYGVPVSHCNNCQRLAAVKRYNDKKMKLNPELYEDVTECLQSENVYKNETKCKDFFFYQHI